MNSPTQNTFASNRTSGAGAAEETLRIIATLPTPEGLEDRVMKALHDARRTANVLPWPSEVRGGWMRSAMARGAAAAAIVFVVGGGSWGVYSRVHPTQTPRIIAMPRVAAPGGFSNAGAMRTPQTLDGPTLVHPVTPAAKHAPAAPRTQTTPIRKKTQKTSKAVAPTKANQ